MLIFGQLFSQNSKKLEIVFIDGYTNLQLKNCDLQLNINKKDFDGISTNSEGKFILPSFSGKKLRIEANTKDSRFYKFHSVYKLKNFPERKITIYFYPNPSYEKYWLAIEDKLYGEVDYSAKTEEDLDMNDKILFEKAQFPGGDEKIQEFIMLFILMRALL
jgi:hypothetical protein